MKNIESQGKFRGPQKISGVRKLVYLDQLCK